MKINKIAITGLLAAALLSSCGLFKKDCNCPHFSKVTAPSKTHNA